MKINLTKNEYQILVEMLTIADWVMHSHNIDNKSHSKKHTDLRNKIFSYHKEFNASNLIDSVDEAGNYFESDDVLELINNKYMAPYEDNVFWDELLHRLSMKDLIKRIGEEKYKSLEPIERMQQIETIKERYIEEFDQYGLENVIINKVELSTEK